MAPSVNNTIDLRREGKRCPTCGQRFSRDCRFCPYDGVMLEPSSFDPREDSLLGTTIDGRYEVMELLGEGGTGRVYKVRHASLARLFAMKTLRRDLTLDEELAARFIQEAKATASIRHPNVVEITDFGRQADGTPYLVMELLVGRTLRDLIKSEGPIPVSRAVPILGRIAAALGAAHAMGIVHRDLKPENVFLVGDAGDVVRVVDFGAAKVVGASRLTRNGIVFGTPHYMSPEQASGKPVDHRADIYALGVVMYEMFTGHVPFEADTYMGVLTQHMFVQPVPPSQARAPSRELGVLEEITLVCLSKKPEERYPSMDQLTIEMWRAEGRRSACTQAVVDEGIVHSAERVAAAWRRVVPWFVFSGLSLGCFAATLALVGTPARRDKDRTAASPAGAVAIDAAPRDLAPSASLLATAASSPGALDGPLPEAGARESSGPPRRPGQGPARPVRDAPRSRPRPQAKAIDDVGDPFTVTR